MKIGIIKPNYPNEKRVAIFPNDIINSSNELIIENNFGEYLGISDVEYLSAGAKIKSREEIFRECKVVFSLKLIQESDYNLLQEGQIIIGWTHPNGSGSDFMKTQALPKSLVIVDLDNISPAVYYSGKRYPIDFIESNFIWRNSYNAGICSVLHAIVTHGILPNSDTTVAVLSIGNVSQGAIATISKFNADTRVYYRKTMKLFYESLGKFDIIINGIELDKTQKHILTKEDLSKLKKGCLIIDAAADAGNAIEGTHYTDISKPIYEEDGIFYYVVNNSPSILYRESSAYISKIFSEVVFNFDIEKFLDLIPYQEKKKLYFQL